MRLLWAVLFYQFVIIYSHEDLNIITKVHSSFLEKYSGYEDVVLLNFLVPTDVSFVSFKFEADEADMSIFGMYDVVN